MFLINSAKYDDLKLKFGAASPANCRSKYDLVMNYYISEGITTGTMADREREWLVTQIGAPTAGTLADLWKIYLVDTVALSGRLSDMIRTWLRS